MADAFDESKSSWASEYKELKEVLTPEEYDSARASTLNAHYTSPTVIRAMYQALENMGFKGGNILEPSCGVGNFFGLLPERMAKSKLYGVELDGLTGRIARQLYPNAHIEIKGYEQTNFEKTPLTLPLATYPSAIIKSMTQLTISWVFPFTIISLQKPWIKCGLGASLPLLLPA